MKIIFFSAFLMISCIGFSQNTDEENITNETDEVPFVEIEEVPIYPGCDSLTTNEYRKNCLNENVKNFVMDKFNIRKAEKFGKK